MEPTGPYSKPWHDNLLKRGKEVRLVAHNKLRSFALHKGFKSKDDEPDAVALAYYGWEYLENPSEFNRIRDPRLQKIYEVILWKQRVIKDMVRNKNRAKALLRSECPELRKRKGNHKAPSNLWPFIAGHYHVLTKTGITRLQNIVNISIGTARIEGFSSELMRLADQIWQVESEKFSKYKQYRELLQHPDFKWMSRIMDLFLLGVVEQAIILAQIYPFAQFCDDKGQELRIALKRKKTPKGFHPTKRIGYRRFHALMGKGKFLRSSGDKESWIVSGAEICRSHLFVWAERVIARRDHKGISNYWYGKTNETKTIQDKYDADIGLGNQTINNLAELSNLEEGVKEAKKAIENDSESALSALLTALMPLLDEVVDKKRSKDYFTQKGIGVLGNWAKSRATDKLVKMLFKEFLMEHKRRLE